MTIFLFTLLVVIYLILTLVNLSAQSQDRFGVFYDEQSKWSQETFGSDLARGPLGPLKHLRKEVEEAIAEAEAKTDNLMYHSRLHMEIVDCFFLVIDAARRSGIGCGTYLLQLAFKKLEINKKRKWQTPKEGEPVEHVRTGEGL